MKRLLLLRHAKAGPETGGGDHARALAPRGTRNAPAMGRAMRAKGYVPELVFCSSARRTRETWALAGPELGSQPIVEFNDGLYLAPWKAILNIAKEAPGNVKTLMIVGHNPGLEDCAAVLLRHVAETGERARREMLAEKFPTGALAVIDCDIADWRALAPACAMLTDFLRPRDLE